MARGQWYILGVLLILFSVIFFTLKTPGGKGRPRSEGFSEVFKIFSSSTAEIKYLCFSGKIRPEGYTCRDIDDALISCGVNITFFGQDYRIKMPLRKSKDCYWRYLLEAPNYTVKEVYLPGRSCRAVDFVGNVSPISWGFNAWGIVFRGGFYGRTFLCGKEPVPGKGILPFKAFSFCSPSNLPDDFEGINLVANPYALPPSFIVVCRNISYGSYTLIKRILQNRGIVVGYMAFCNSTHCGGLNIVEFSSQKAVKGRSVLSGLPLAGSKFFLEDCPEPLAVAEEDSSLSSICVFPYFGGDVVFLGSQDYVTQDIITSLERYFGIDAHSVKVRGCG